MTDLIDFTNAHDACEDGQQWVEQMHHQRSPMSSLWGDTSIPSRHKIWVATRKDIMSNEEQHMFADYCIDRVVDYLDPRVWVVTNAADLHLQGTIDCKAFNHIRMAVIASIKSDRKIQLLERVAMGMPWQPHRGSVSILWHIAQSTAWLESQVKKIIDPTSWDEDDKVASTTAWDHLATAAYDQQAEHINAIIKNPFATDDPFEG